MSINDPKFMLTQPLQDDEVEIVEPVARRPYNASSSKMAKTSQIRITSNLKVDKLTHITQVPSTLTVPRLENSEVYLLDLTGVKLPTKSESGGQYTMDAYIRAEACSCDVITIYI